MEGKTHWRRKAAYLGTYFCDEFIRFIADNFHSHPTEATHNNNKKIRKNVFAFFLSSFISLCCKCSFCSCYDLISFSRFFLCVCAVAAAFRLFCVCFYWAHCHWLQKKKTHTATRDRVKRKKRTEKNFFWNVWWLRIFRTKKEQKQNKEKMNM